MVEVGPGQPDANVISYTKTTMGQVAQAQFFSATLKALTPLKIMIIDQKSNLLCLIEVQGEAFTTNTMPLLPPICARAFVGACKIHTQMAQRGAVR